MNTKRKFSGAALYQYGIILCLIALALVPVYFLLGNQIVACLSNYSNTFTDINKAVNQNSITDLSNLKAGDLAGTPDEPVEKCISGKCSIDYGDYIINAIPENYQDYVKANGASGGNDMLASVLSQIANQLKDEGDIDGFQEYQTLAELTHFMAQIEKTSENIASECQNSETLLNDCIMKKAIFSSPITLPDSLSGILTKYPKNDFDTEIRENELGLMRRWISACDPKARASCAAVKYYDQIMANPKYSDNLKNITTKLFNNINELSFTSKSMYFELICDKEDTTYEHTQQLYDVKTGELIRTDDYSSTPISVDMFKAPQISTGNHLNAALVCTSGHNYDNGDECKKK